MSASLRHTLKLLSLHDGTARAQFHDVSGRLLGRGSLCVFPTVKTANRSILNHYTISLPARAMARLRAGKHTVVFETYRPFEGGRPDLNHIAWVLTLEP